jgi:branched-chain amino acid aminotransferase
VSRVWLNGALVDEREARISPFDRGLLLGDAVFETLRAYKGRPHALAAHLARLRASCEATRLAFPEGMERAVAETLAANGLDDCSVRITVTRGPGGRGSSPRGAGPQTVLVTCAPIHHAPEVYARGLRLATARRRRIGPESMSSAVKSTNYLVHVLARVEAEEAGADDALFVDEDGCVVEATQANVFALLGDDLVTPPLDSGCLPGQTRAEVLALAPELGLKPIERTLPVEALQEAREVMLTASVLEVAPVVELDGVRIGGGVPGPVTRALHELYRKRAMGE